MPIARLSVRSTDEADDHCARLHALARLIATAIERRQITDDDVAWAMLAAVEEAMASGNQLRDWICELDNAFRAIGAIAQAGTRTEKVHRVLREIVRDHERLIEGSEVGEETRAT